MCPEAAPAADVLHAVHERGYTVVPFLSHGDVVELRDRFDALAVPPDPHARARPADGRVYLRKPLPDRLDESVALALKPLDFRHVLFVAHSPQVTLDSVSG